MRFFITLPRYYPQVGTILIGIMLWVSLSVPKIIQFGSSNDENVP